MPVTRTAERRLLKWGLLFGFWTLIGLSFATQFYLSSSKAGLSITWTQAILWALGDWYVFALLSLPVIAVARQFRLEGPDWPKHAALHAAGSMVFSLVYMLLRVGVALIQEKLDGRSFSFIKAFDDLLLKTWHFNLLIYWVIVCVWHAFDYYQRYQEREVRAAELEKRLTAARLQALQMQLNPHFLFNTLHAISALMHKNVDDADRMIAQLSDLLRYALESTDAQEVPLRQDLDFLGRYLEIEQTRFGDRLRVERHIADNTLDALVPSLILQPLVENAIQHGIEPQAKPGLVTLSARRAGDWLELEVADNGVGLSKSEPQPGVGLSNTRARLLQLYREQHRFECNNGAQGGVTVRVTIPFRTAR